MDLPSPILEAISHESETKKNLLYTIQHLNARGLTKSALWASQMLSALPECADGSDRGMSVETDASISAHSQNPMYLLAKGYFDSRQYQRAAASLTVLQTPIARFLRLYSIYLAGEKRKEEERQQLADFSDPENSELEYLLEILNSLKDEGGLDGFMWYLLGVVLKKLRLNDKASDALQEAILLVPFNWGAWLELAPLCETREAVETLKLEHHWMKYLFLGHFLNETDQSSEARDLYKNILEYIPRSVFVRGQYALALYHLRSFDEALTIFDEMYEDDEYCLEGADIYSNILYVKEDRLRLSILANRCMKVDKFSLETCCVVGNYYALRGQHEQALSYFQRALKLDRNYLAAWTLMGHEFLEMKNTAAAVEAYRRAVDINPKDFRAWYGLGQTYELLEMPRYALYYYQKAAALKPHDARMWCAVGQTLQDLRKWDEAVRCYERAIGCDDNEGVALSQLAFLYERMARESRRDGRQHERTALCLQRAAKYYAANLARRDEHKLAGQETADALRFLAEHWFAKNDTRKAKAYCVRLLDHPGHDKDFVKTLLRQIHARESDA